MNLLVLNQYGPGDASPTARLLRDLVEDWRAHGHTVAVAAAANDYRAQRVARGWRRWLRELVGLVRIGWRSLRASPRPDVVISFTSPPGLIVLGALAARWHKARSIHWALDLYPDLALALGELRAGPLARAVSKAVRWAYGCTNRVITLDADMRERLRAYDVEAGLIAPWSPLRESLTVNVTPSQPPVWLYSGNLGRAHEWETLLRMQLDLERRATAWELVIAGGGAAREAAQRWAAQHGLRRCQWRDYFTEETLVNDLLRASVLVATQRLAARGLLWPSKLALLTRLPRPILWIGPTDGATADVLARHPAGAGVFSPDEIRMAVDWMLQQPVLTSEHAAPEKVESDRAEKLALWRRELELTCS